MSLSVACTASIRQAQRFRGHCGASPCAGPEHLRYGKLAVTRSPREYCNHLTSVLSQNDRRNFGSAPAQRVIADLPFHVYENDEISVIPDNCNTVVRLVDRLI